MAIDPDKAKTLALQPATVQVERGSIRFFAQSIGETNPVYLDLEAAIQAGHRDLPVPPTYFFSMELGAGDPFAYLTELGIDLRQVLHGEQSFTYHSTAYAGETLTLKPAIVDAFSKKGGAMDFLVKRTDIVRGSDVLAEATATLIVQNPEVAR